MNTVKMRDGRVHWVDYAKGFCIIFVVTMHSTLGVEAAVGQNGWMHAVVAFALPFRMPDFFISSGGCSSPMSSIATGALISTARSYILHISISSG
jgi:uncharacterized membrane protein YcfT